MHRTGELFGQFETMEQQRESASFGMWVFLSTEVLFFGGMFMTYTLNRSTYPDVFGEASRSIDLTLGAINTVVLIGSSLTMAMSVWASQVGKKQLVTIFLIATLILGCVFLGIKGIEYHQKFVEHHVPGLNFSFEPGAVGRHQRPRATVFLALFCDDRPARPAHDYRRRPAHLAHQGIDARTLHRRNTTRRSNW